MRAAKASARSGRRYSSCTSGLPRLHLKWVCNPTCPQKVCAYSLRELRICLVHCLWLAWSCLAGFLGYGLAKYLGSAWGMYQVPYGYGSGTPKLVRRAGSHGPSHHGRIAIERPCFAAQRPRACGPMTTCFLEAERGWSTGSWKSWALRLGGNAAGMLCAGVAALRVTFATPKCSSSSGGAAGAVLGPPCGMQQLSRTRQSWALYDCLRSQERWGQRGFSPIWRSGPPICSQRRLSPFRRRRSTPQLGQRICWTPPPPQLHPSLWGGDLQGELEPPDPPRRPPAPVFPPRPPPPDPGEWVEPLLRSTPLQLRV